MPSELGAALRSLIEDTSGPPWSVGYFGGKRDGIHVGGKKLGEGPNVLTRMHEDAVFIAAARNLWPYLLAVVEAAEANLPSDYPYDLPDENMVDVLSWVKTMREQRDAVAVLCGALQNEGMVDDG